MKDYSVFYKKYKQNKYVHKKKGQSKKENDIENEDLEISSQKHPTETFRRESEFFTEN